MQFLKKHYEKVLLSIVLLGLAAAAAALPWQVSHERDRLEEIQRNLTVKVKAKPFKPMDDWVSSNKAAVARLEAPLNLELSGPHNVFNPVLWKRAGGRIFPVRRGTEIGPGAVKISQIRELALTVTFDAVEAGNNPGDPPKYKVTVKRETEASPKGDTRQVSVATPHLTLFDLISVQGPTNEPTALVLKLKDDEAITVAKDKPFSKVIGYAADMVYHSPSGKQQPFNNKKVNDSIKLEEDPETYKIVAITRNEVVLSADSNKRRWVIKYNPSNATASAK